MEIGLADSRLLAALAVSLLLFITIGVGYLTFIDATDKRRRLDAAKPKRQRRK